MDAYWGSLLNFLSSGVITIYCGQLYMSGNNQPVSHLINTNASTSFLFGYKITTIKNLSFLYKYLKNKQSIYFVNVLQRLACI